MRLGPAAGSAVFTSPSVTPHSGRFLKDPEQICFPERLSREAGHNRHEYAFTCQAADRASPSAIAF
jgi:hypothetical protein